MVILKGCNMTIKLLCGQEVYCVTVLTLKIEYFLEYIAAVYFFDCWDLTPVNTDGGTAAYESVFCFFSNTHQLLINAI